MAVEGITGAVASFQNSNTQTYTVTPVSQNTAHPHLEESGASASISQEVVTVKGEKNASGNTGEGQQDEQKQPSKETVKQALSDINKKLSNTECLWGVDDATNRITIKIVDKESKEVIKELPPEKTLEMIAKAWELAGIMVDEKL